MASDYTNRLLRLSLLMFECFMALAYIGISIALFFVPFIRMRFIELGIDKMRIGLGVILGFYGLFRVFRAYKKLTLKDE